MSPPFQCYEKVFCVVCQKSFFLNQWKLTCQNSQIITSIHCTCTCLSASISPPCIINRFTQIMIQCPLDVVQIENFWSVAVESWSEPWNQVELGCNDKWGLWLPVGTPDSLSITFLTPCKLRQFSFPGTHLNRNMLLVLKSMNVFGRPLLSFGDRKTKASHVSAGEGGFHLAQVLRKDDIIKMCIVKLEKDLLKWI